MKRTQDQLGLDLFITKITDNKAGISEVISNLIAGEKELAPNSTENEIQILVNNIVNRIDVAIKDLGTSRSYGDCNSETTQQFLQTLKTEEFSESPYFKKWIQQLENDCEKPRINTDVVQDEGISNFDEVDDGSLIGLD